MVAPICSLLRNVGDIPIGRVRIQQDMEWDLSRTCVKRTNSSFVRTTVRILKPPNNGCWSFWPSFCLDSLIETFRKYLFKAFQCHIFGLLNLMAVLNNKPIQPSKTYIFSIWIKVFVRLPWIRSGESQNGNGAYLSLGC